MPRLVTTYKNFKMCATCIYWGGFRTTDSFGYITYDFDNNIGKCNQVGWKGFSGCDVSSESGCQDYEPLFR